MSASVPENASENVSVLNELLAGNPGIWRGNHRAETASRGVGTGFPELDDQLPTKGWPAGSIVELVVEHEGIGELQLLFPAMARLSNDGEWIVWIASPYVPYAPALMANDVELSHCVAIRSRGANDAAWAMEKVLRSTVCGMALVWPDRRFNDQMIRRLQLAAETGGSLGVLFYKQAPAASPAALRLHLSRAGDRLRVRVLKARGMHARPVVELKKV